VPWIIFIKYNKSLIFCASDMLFQPKELLHFYLVQFLFLFLNFFCNINYLKKSFIIIIFFFHVGPKDPQIVSRTYSFTSGLCSHTKQNHYHLHQLFALFFYQQILQQTDFHKFLIPIFSIQVQKMHMEFHFLLYLHLLLMMIKSMFVSGSYTLPTSNTISPV
jgi:hypothetical protein